MFPCTGCGLCCQHISGIPELSDFDDGSGVCRHYDYVHKQCRIYDQRPDICNVEKMFGRTYYQMMSKEAFYRENAKVCNQLQETYKTDEVYRVKTGD